MPRYDNPDLQVGTEAPAVDNRLDYGTIPVDAPSPEINWGQASRTPNRPYSGPTATLRHYQPLDPYEKRDLRRQSVDQVVKIMSNNNLEINDVIGLAKDIYRYMAYGKIRRPNAT